jgi:hypothetical protein
MRERLAWFLIGAVVAGSAVALLAGRTPQVSAPRAGADRQDEIIRKLERIEGRLSAIEVGGNGLARGAPTPPAGTAAPTDSPAAPQNVALTPEQQRAIETGGGIVQRAIGAGTWSKQDAADFSMASLQMRGEDRYRLMRELAVAINEDRVKVESGVDLLQ